MNGTTRWWWLRHAAIDDAPRAIHGRDDVAADLTDTAALAALAAHLPEGALWLTSGLRRARETAEALSRRLTPPLGTIDAFAEQDFGLWEGRRWEEIEADTANVFWSDPTGNRPPEGESFVVMTARVQAAIATVGRENRGRDIVVVAHAGPIRAALSLALSLAPKSALSLRIDPLSLTRIDAVDGNGETSWRVGGVNLMPG